jgi:hypothetical protein
MVDNNIKNKNFRNLYSDDKSMNEELLEWIKETKTNLNINEEKTNDNTIQKPQGKCEICGEKTAKEICVKCKKSVCISCYFQLIGVCKKCVPKETAEKWKNEHPDWEKVLGVKWVG